MKSAVYFEDLQKTNFVIKVVEGEHSYLESRTWYNNSYESSPGDEFDRFRKQREWDGVTLYKWIEERSQLSGVSTDTEQWMDRKWVPVGTL